MGKFHRKKKLTNIVRKRYLYALSMKGSIWVNTEDQTTWLCLGGFKNNYQWQQLN